MLPKTILVISPVFPYPPTQGTKHDVWGHVTFFHNAGWQVVLVVCEREPEVSHTKLPIDIDLYFVHCCWSYDFLTTAEQPETVVRVQKLINFYKPHVLWVEYAHIALLASALTLNGAKLWFRPHNFELAHALDKTFACPPWLDWQGYNAPGKALAWAKSYLPYLWRIFTTEQLMYRIADRLFFISHSDMHFMSRLYKGAVCKDWVIPFLECKQIPVKDGKNPLNIIYLGAYVDRLNRAGACMLLSQLIPAIEAAMPGAFRFHVVGRGNREHFGQYASETVIIHDFIENLSDFLQDMDVACLPVKFGWGCKIKMLEALASGLPVVGARQTFRGVPLIQGAYYACHTTQDYVEALKQLQDIDTRRHVALAGKAAYTAWLSAGQRILHTALKEVKNIENFT
jgi:glycosyltransferase involved in cell wall biosynthesis